MDDARPIGLLPLSVLIRSLNEADRIGDTIRSALPLGAEIVVVDAGSRDATVEIAQGLGARVIVNPWPGFGPQRRFGEEQCTHDFIFSLDADEVLTPQIVAEIRSVFARRQRPSLMVVRKAIIFPRRKKPPPLGFCHEQILIYDRRIARTGLNPNWDKLEIATAEKPHTIRAPLWHFTYRDWAHAISKGSYVAKLAADTQPVRSKWYLAPRLIFEFPTTFIKFYVFRRYCLGGRPGLIMALVSAYGRFLRIAMMLDRSMRERAARTRPAATITPAAQGGVQTGASSPPTLPEIVVINLDRDADRLQHMSRELASAGLAFTRHPGILGRSVPPRLAPYFEVEEAGAGAPLKHGEIGCYASHLDVLRDIAEGRRGPAAVVMEDDLSIDADFGDMLKGLMASLPDGWEMVRLSNAPKRAFIAVKPLANGRSLAKYSKIPNSAGAYLVSRAGAAKLIAQKPRRRPFDEDLRRPWNYDLCVFGVVPPPITPDCLTSTIDALDPGRLTGRGGLPGRLRRVAWGESFRRVSFNMRDLGPKLWLGCLFQNASARLRLRAKAPTPLMRASAPPEPDRLGA